MTRHRKFMTTCLVAAVSAVAISGCGDDNSSSNSSKTTETNAEVKLDKAALELGQQIAELRGHYVAAKALYEEKKYKEAKVHADHPVSELYSSFRQAVVERNPELDKEVKAELESGVELLNERAPAKQFNAQLDKTSELMDQVFETAHPETDQQLPEFRAAVAASILSTASDEYGLAIKDGKIDLLAEYQDSYGFLTYCRLLTDDLKDEEELGDQSGNIDQNLAKLENGPYSSGVNAPEKPQDPATVTPVADAVVNSINTAFGGDLLPAETAKQQLQALADTLDQAAEAYSAKETEKALDTANSAYLKNFEGLEADLAKENNELMLEIESLVGVKIPDLIRDNASQAELDKTIKQVKKLLPEAEKALGGAGDTAY